MSDKKVYVTRREVFSASHRLYNNKWTEERNTEVFGKCSNVYGHGHNYILEVTVVGTVNPDTGYVIDTKELKKIIRENVVNKLDHKNLNMDVDFMKDVIPTAENIAIKIWEQLENKIVSGTLYSVKIYETENNYFEFKG